MAAELPKLKRLDVLCSRRSTPAVIPSVSDLVAFATAAPAGACVRVSEGLLSAPEMAEGQEVVGKLRQAFERGPVTLLRCRLQA